MPGVPGKGGQLPKRSTARAGHRTKAEKAETESVEVDSGPVTIPPADDSWHSIAKSWYIALADSGQSRFMEPSDWAGAQYVAQAMTQNLTDGKFSAMMFTAVWSAMNDLLTTEGARRRVKIEVERSGAGDQQTPAGVAVLDDYRDSITG